ncbi:hypothetical protein RA307_17915 [Xanthobacteraceae bacterium Astr-EGSB]|uniref:hypothetical protein n=1 Tax=Astrobacterium formosum TaxID=3069710 RepID=UPI0027B22116|nr:hypothetical protein [Xanthobacteraceae bacterium Astr-EGSB]
MGKFTCHRARVGREDMDRSRRGCVRNHSRIKATRLILAPITAEHAADLHRVYADPRAMRFFCADEWRPGAPRCERLTIEARSWCRCYRSRTCAPAPSSIGDELDLGIAFIGGESPVYSAAWLGARLFAGAQHPFRHVRRAAVRLPVFSVRVRTEPGSTNSAGSNVCVVW